MYLYVHIYLSLQSLTHSLVSHETNIYAYAYLLISDLEWKVVYVASAEDSALDQTLEEVLVGPVPVGVNKFVLQADAPDYKSIPENDILGVTVILITCSYKEQEFARVGYYVNNEYGEEFDPEVGPPKPLDMSKVNRQILADKPRVTRFPIDWGGNSSSETLMPSPEDELQQDQEMSNSAIVEDSDMETHSKQYSSGKSYENSREVDSIVSHSDTEMMVS